MQVHGYQDSSGWRVEGFMYNAEENLHHFENEIDIQISKLGTTLNTDDLTPTVMYRT